jgi:hypothetical protein
VQGIVEASRREWFSSSRVGNRQNDLRVERIFELSIIKDELARH